MMELSKSSVVLLFIFSLKILHVFGTEIIEISEDKLRKDDLNHECQFNNTTTTCNYTSSVRKGLQLLLSQLNGTQGKLMIIGAPKIIIKKNLCCYSHVTIVKSQDVVIDDGYNQKEKKTFRLQLEDSTGTSIQNEAINYTKCIRSKITNLTLLKVGEFDMEHCTITTFIAVTKGLSPSIIQSNIDSLNVTIGAGSTFTINQSKIGVVEQIKFDSSNPSRISNSSFLNIKENGMVISKEADVSLIEVELGYLDHKSVVVNGNLTMRNVKHSRSYPPDWLVLNPGGSLKFYPSPSEENSSYIIKSDETEIFPSKVIYAKQKVWVAATLGALLFIAVVCITLMLLWFFFFFPKRNSALSSVLKVKVEKQDLVVSEEKEEKQLNNSPLEAVVMHNSNQYIVRKEKPPPPIRKGSQPKLPETPEVEEEEQVDYTENTVTEEGLVDYSDVDTTGFCNANAPLPYNPLPKPACLPNRPTYPYQRDQIPSKPAVPTRKPPGGLPLHPNKSFLQQQNTRVLPPAPPKSVTAYGAQNMSKHLPPPPKRKSTLEDEDAYESQNEYDGDYEENEV